MSKLPPLGPDTAIAGPVDGDFVVTAYRTKIACHELPGGRELWRRDGGPLVAVSANGRVVADGAAARIRILDARSAQPLAELAPPAGWSPLSAVALTEEGTRVIAADTSGRVGCWLSTGGRMLWSARPHVEPVVALAVSPAGAVATASEDYSVAVLDPDGHVRAPSTAHRGCLSKILPLGDDRVATTALDDAILIRDAVTGDVRARLAGSSGSVTELAASPDRRFLAAQGFQRPTVTRWDLTDGSAAHLQRDALPRVRGYVAVSADGRTVYHGEMSALMRWSLADQRNEKLHGFERQPSSACALTGGRLAVGDVDGAVRIFDPRDLSWSAPLLLREQAVVRLTESSGRVLAMWASNTAIERACVVDVESGRLVWEFDVQVYHPIAMSGTHLVIASPDGLLRLFDADAKREIARLADDLDGDRIMTVAITPGRIYAGTARGLVRVYHITR